MRPTQLNEVYIRRLPKTHMKMSTNTGSSPFLLSSCVRPLALRYGAIIFKLSFNMAWVSSLWWDGLFYLLSHPWSVFYVCFLSKFYFEGPGVKAGGVVSCSHVTAQSTLMNPFSRMKITLRQTYKKMTYFFIFLNFEWLTRLFNTNTHLIYSFKKCRICYFGLFCKFLVCVIFCFTLPASVLSFHFLFFALLWLV